MKIHKQYFSAVLFAVLTIATPQTHADRLDANTLSECIAKADIIAYGTISKILQGEKNDTVIMNDFGCLKGTYDKEIIQIIFPKLNVEGPISVETRGTYFFFLKKEPTVSGLYKMFNEYDGVVQYSGPVFGEIITQLGLVDNPKEKPNQKLQPTVKTPVESGKVQGTAAEL